MAKRRREAAHQWGTTDLSTFSMLELPIPSFVFENGRGWVLAMNPAAKALFGVTALAPTGTTTVLDLLGHDLEMKAGSSGHRRVTLPGQRTFDLIIGATHPSTADDPPRSLAMLVPSFDAPAEPDDTPPVVGWDRVAERCRAFEGDVLCIAVGVVGLTAVNAHFGRGAGDAAIAEIHHRLAHTGGDDCVVERVSGTCFLALLPSGAGDRPTVQLFLDAVRQPITGPFGVVVLGSAAGVSVGQPRRPLFLIDRAVGNLQVALGRGAGTSEWGESVSRMKTTLPDLAARLLGAVQEGDIVAAFQPVVSLDAGEIIEYEALARWPGHEYVNPRRMVELAGDIGVQGEFRSCVVASAVDLLGRHVGSESIRRVSIDVTCKEFASDAFAETVLSMFASANIGISWLQIEITDGLADVEVARVASTIDALRSLGVRIALDGLSGGAVDWLALMRLDVDAIKVESDLLATGQQDGRAGALLRSILELGAELGVDVIAKGVETAEQHAQLVSAGCQLAQGWLYAAPAPVDSVDPMFTATVRRNWKQAECSRRPRALGAIGTRLRGLHPPLSAGVWLDVGPVAPQVVTDGGYSGAAIDQPDNRVDEEPHVDHRPIADT